MRVVFLGPPGSGKGTQAQRLAEPLRVPQISTGDLFRDHRKRGTSLGLRVEGIMARGHLVDDATVIDMVRDRIQQADALNGFILDGFPRTLPQAEGFAAMLADLKLTLDRVVLFKVPNDDLVKRISGRRTCADCQRVFNIYTAPPSVPPPCGGQCQIPKLTQRKDDEEATVVERLAVYERDTRPLADFYRARGLLREVDAIGSLSAVTARVQTALN
jgi:adenylate kinase